jgi:hypothetical protein
MDDTIFTDLLDDCLPDVAAWKHENFDILILDEAQDMRPHYWKLIKRLVSTFAELSTLKVLVLGDPNQLLYDFYAGSPADVRFLTMAADLFVGSRSWVRRELSTSYRLTYPMAAFVKHFANGNIFGHEEGVPVMLYVCSLVQELPIHGLACVKSVLETSQCDDLLILTSSTNERSIVSGLVRQMVSSRIPVHVHRSGRLTDTHVKGLKHITKGKVSISTFCGTKGLEADTVVVINRGPLFDVKWSNSLYVAMTRARKRLIIFQESRYVCQEAVAELALQFSEAQLHIKVIGELQATRTPASPRARRTTYDGESLFAFSSSELLKELDLMVECKELVEVMDKEKEEGFSQATTISFDDGATCTSMASIVMRTFEFGLVLDTQRGKDDFGTFPVLSKIKQILTRPQVFGVANDNQTETMRCRFVQAHQVIKMPQRDSDDADTDCLRKFKAMAMIASVHDCYAGFADRCYGLDNFDFMSNIHLYECFRRARHKLAIALGVRPWESPLPVLTDVDQERREAALVGEMDLVYQTRSQLTCKLDNAETGKPMTVRVYAGLHILGRKSGVAILFTDRTGIDQKLAAALSSCVFKQPYVHLLNIRTGDLVRVGVKGDQMDFVCTALEFHTDQSNSDVSDEAFLDTMRIDPVVELEL